MQSYCQGTACECYVCGAGICGDGERNEWGHLTEKSVSGVGPCGGWGIYRVVALLTKAQE